MTKGPRTGKLNTANNGRPGRAALRKIGSKAGASITFALLIFLVCAVVGSVILVAGTSAAGRLAEMAEYDQRYYNVTSAAELLKDKLDGYSVTIKQYRIDTETQEAQYTYDSNGVVTSRTMAVTGSSTNYSATISGSDDANARPIINGVSQSLLRDCAIDLVFNPSGTYDFTSETAFDSNFPAMTAEEAHTLNITHDAGTSGLTADKLAVDATMTLFPSGDIRIVLSNKTDVASEKYEIVMILKANVEPNNSSSTSVSGQGTDTVTTTATLTKTTTITWTVGDVY